MKDQRWTDALDAIIKASETSHAKSGLIHYAATYAKAGYLMTGEDRRVQALYILSNLGNWRGETAKATKAIITEYTKR